MRGIVHCREELVHGVGSSRHGREGDTFNTAQLFDEVCVQADNKSLLLELFVIVMRIDGVFHLGSRDSIYPDTVSQTFCLPRLPLTSSATSTTSPGLQILPGACRPLNVFFFFWNFSFSACAASASWCRFSGWLVSV